MSQLALAKQYLAIRIVPTPDGEDDDLSCVLVHFVQDAILADTDTPCPVAID